MPLDKSGSKESIGFNYNAEKAAGKPKKQALAIALDVARRAGGKVKPKPKHKKDKPNPMNKLAKLKLGY